MRLQRLLPLLLPLLLLPTTGCIAPMGRPAPAPAPAPTPDPDGDISEIEGTVRWVDPSNRAIDLDDSRLVNRLGGADEDRSRRLYWVEGTDVEYRGEYYRPEDLEPGDEISAVVGLRGGRLVTDRIEVLYDSTGDDLRDDRRADLRGVVEWVDTRDRVLQIRADRVDRYGARFVPGDDDDDESIRLIWDASTTVEFRGRLYDPTHLERGDEIEVETLRRGGEIYADEIVVLRDARGR